MLIPLANEGPSRELLKYANISLRNLILKGISMDRVLMIKKGLISILLSIILVFFMTSVQAVDEEESWSEWVKELRVQAVSQGIDPSLFDRVFSTIPGPSAKVLNLYHTQPEKRLTFWEYRSTRANAARIEKGHQEFEKHRVLVDKIGEDYGVDPCVIVALWGLETDYGSFMGTFPVIQSLSTLAYDSQRKAFFRGELLLALKILQEGQISLADFIGEWAGASGYPQFMPSSWFKYAVDYDGNGHKDIWKSLPDGLASIANYLAKNGWRRGEPWSIEVTLPANFDPSLLGKQVIKNVSEWRSLGVEAQNTWPKADLPASIIQISSGPTLMIYNNFRALQTWNGSSYYVPTVGYLADHICRAH